MGQGTVDYSKGLIYKVCCKDASITDIYIGSTTNMIKRRNRHKYSCNTLSDNGYHYKIYRFIRENGGWDNWTMVLVEYVNATSKQELQKEERVIIELLKPTLNSEVPTRTNNEYYIDNKDKWLKQVKCELCDCLLNKSSLKRHQKRNICKKFQIVED